MTRPILYSFRRCPYAMRARMAIAYSGIDVELREVVLSNKPKSMLVYSPKATVPVLVLPDQTVIDESREIIRWALSIADPDNWLPQESALKIAEQLIDKNDTSFKQALDKYKYHVRHPQQSVDVYRAEGEAFLKTLETRLSETKYLLGPQISMADVAIFPFVRQFAHVDKDWFAQTPYVKLQRWLEGFLQLALFEEVMRKHVPWKDEG